MSPQFPSSIGSFVLRQASSGAARTLVETSQLVGWSTEQEPARAGARADSSLIDEAAHSYAHRWAAGTHDGGEQFVRKRYVEQYPLRGYGAPPVSELPKHEQDSIIEAAQVADREVERQPVGALHGAPRDGRRDLWPPAYQGAEPAIEHRYLDRLDHFPPHPHCDRLIGADPQPWLQHVTQADELDRRVVADRDPSSEQTFDDQQPEVCDMVEIIWADDPCPAAVTPDVGHEPRARYRQVVVTQVLPLSPDRTQGSKRP